MLSPIIERRCKDKNNLANDVQCEPFFFKNASFFLFLAVSAPEIFHFSSFFRVCDCKGRERKLKMEGM